MPEMLIELYTFEDFSQQEVEDLARRLRTLDPSTDVRVVNDEELYPGGGNYAEFIILWLSLSDIPWSDIASGAARGLAGEAVRVASDWLRSLPVRERKPHSSTSEPHLPEMITHPTRELLVCSSSGRVIGRVRVERPGAEPQFIEETSAKDKNRERLLHRTVTEWPSGGRWDS